MLASLVLTSPAYAQGDSPPPQVKRAMDELWRRGHCLLSSVLVPAGKESAVPKDIGETPVLNPRTFSRKGKLLCYAVDGQTLWAAADHSLYEVDGAAGKVLRRFGQPDGLPDRPIQSIARDGDNVWLATRGGLAGLDRKTGKITTLDGVKFNLGRLCTGPSGVWLVSDAGAWWLALGKREWQRLPDFPGQAQLAQVVGRGFWERLWRNRTLALLPSIFATDDGLYVICIDRLLGFDAAAKRWKQISTQTWQASPQGRTVWGLATSGVVRYDPATGKTDSFKAGNGLAPGRPIAMAATPQAFFVTSQPDYDSTAKAFVGGGISRLETASGNWAVTEKVDDVDVRFAGAMLSCGDEVWVACTLYDKIVQLGAHPGMAHVKRWRPHASGLGLLHWKAGRWTLIKSGSLKNEHRWIMGQRGTVKPDRIGPESVEALCGCGRRVWGVYRMIPERYYAGYYLSAGCLAAEPDGRWQGRFDIRNDELAVGGEQPELLLISHSHGHKIVFAEGHPALLGIEQVAGRTWAIFENGLSVYDAKADRYLPVVRKGLRFYWRATAAAAGKEAVWFGGDGGTISRLDRRSGRLELVGVVPDRKIVTIAADGNRVVARTEKTTVTLPVSLRSTRKFPDADALVFDGERWSAASAKVKPATSSLTCGKKGNYLYDGQKRIAFLKGVFRPVVLCEDKVGGMLWLATYSGVCGVPLPGTGRAGE